MLKPKFWFVFINHLLVRSTKCSNFKHNIFIKYYQMESWKDIWINDSSIKGLVGCRSLYVQQRGVYFCMKIWKGTIQLHVSICIKQLWVMMLFKIQDFIWLFWLRKIIWYGVLKNFQKIEDHISFGFIHSYNIIKLSLKIKCVDITIFYVDFVQRYLKAEIAFKNESLQNFIFSKIYQFSIKLFWK